MEPAPEEIAVREMTQRYRNVFGTPEGRAVLGDILTHGHYGVTLDTDNPTQVAEYNFSLLIATRAGIFDPIYQQLGFTKET